MKKVKDFLLEIHTEELPPKSLQALEKALADGIKKGLIDSGLEHGDIQSFSTPRRLAVIVKSLSKTQPSQVIERRGPSTKAAYDNNGEPTKACSGFAASCGVEVNQLEKISTEKGEFLYFKTEKEGKTVFELMPEIVITAIKSLPIKKPMRWSHHKVEFARPIHSVVMMYGRKVIPAEVLGQMAATTTKGHRFHQKKTLKIKSPKHYERTLKKCGFVIPNFVERRELILEQAFALAKKYQGSVLIEQPLLDEVTAIVEWPTALIGKFPSKYLKLPREVLISTMQDHQKCFPVVDERGDLMPLFVTISNLQSLKPEEVVKGNERVMVARLADAEFFYKADLMLPLEKYREDLRNVVFQARLGSLYDKAERVEKLAKYIAEKCDFNETLAMRAAQLSKCDLMTSMVGEFPELQGFMGFYYAKQDQEPSEVAAAMREQYMPANAEAALPETKTGMVLSLADRIDTLVGIFGINKMPTGDKDPFALRRAALGVVRLLVKLPKISLTSLISFSIARGYENLPLENQRVYNDVTTFIRERLKYWLLSQGYSANQFAAVDEAGFSEIPDFIERMKAVKFFASLPESENLAAANKRVRNILIKAGMDNSHSLPIDKALLQEPAEVELAKAIEIHEAEQKHLKYYPTRLKSLATLREPVDAFFDNVMVMSDDATLQRNRLALLSRLRSLFLAIADISLLS